MAQSLSVLRAEVTGDRAYPRALAAGHIRMVQDKTSRHAKASATPAQGQCEMDLGGQKIRMPMQCERTRSPGGRCAENVSNSAWVIGCAVIVPWCAWGRGWQALQVVD
jgi:hypothetical protein